MTDKPTQYSKGGDSVKPTHPVKVINVFRIKGTCERCGLESLAHGDNPKFIWCTYCAKVQGDGDG